MKKNLNKLATLALTGAMVAGMSFGAFADENENNSDKVLNKFAVNKVMTVQDGVYVPSMKFNFTASKADANKDAGALLTTTNGYEVYNGLDGEFTGSVEYTNGDFATADGAKTEVVKTAELTAATYTKAGIYRYTVAEGNLAGDNVDLLGTSVKMDKTAKYLDVYVEKNGDEYVVKNCVLHAANTNPTVTKNEKTGAYEVNYGEGKADGIHNSYSTKHDPSNPETPGNPEKPGKNEEDNSITLKKEVTGAYGTANSGEFEFTVKFNNAETGMSVKVGSKTEILGADKDITVTLKNNDSVTITGIPAGIEYTISEKAGEGSWKTSYAVYKSSTATTDSDKLGTDGDATLDERKIGTNLTDYVVCTNELQSITVTGVAMNIAPYAAMVLGAGAFAGVFLGGKRRKAEDED